MKYIAIFDIPDGYGIGSAVAKAKCAPKGKEVYEESDFEYVYAQVEPLSERKAEVFERFNAVDRVIQDLNISCCYDMPGFWCKNGKDYKVIPTKYHKGYMQALEDVEKAIRSRFWFGEREEIFMPFFASDGKEGIEE